MTQTAYNKQTNKEWIATENLLKLDTISTNQSVSIPYQSIYDIFELSSGVGSVSVIFSVKQFGTSAYIRLVGTRTEPDYNGWCIGIANPAYQFAGRILTYTIRGGSYSLSMHNATFSANKLYHLVVTKNGTTYTSYLNGRLLSVDLVDNGSPVTVVTGKGIKMGSTEKVEPTVNNDAIVYTSNLSFYNKVLTQLEVDVLYNEIGLVPKSLHPYCVGFWTMQERYGNKVYDSVDGFNYAKPQLIRDPTLLNGLSEFVKFHETDGGSSISYNSTTKCINITNGAAVSTAGAHPSIYTNYTLPILGATSYTVEVDVETNTNWGVVIDGTTTLTLTANTGVRSIQKLTFTRSVGISLLVGFETTTNIDNKYINIYGIKIYETAKGAPLINNHADLIGYTDTELGITDKTTQTAKVDFYSKSVTSRWDGSGNDLKTGLPELKNAVSVDGGGIVMNVPVTGVGSFIGTDNTCLDYTFILGTGATVNRRILTYTTNPANYTVRGYMEIRLEVGRVVVYAGGSSQSISADLPTTPGIYRIQIQRIGQRQLQILCNGRVIPFITSVGTFHLGNGKYAALDSSNYVTADFFFQDTDIMRINDVQTSYAIAFGIRKGNIDIKHSLNLYNNLLVSNPIDVSRTWARWYQLGNVDSSGYTVDTTGKGTNLYTGWNGNYVNPAHADYVIKTINSLR